MASHDADSALRVCRRSGYSATRLGEDVVRVLDALKLREAVLVEHSVAGEELSAVGATNSNRIVGLIYLDAAWDRTYSPSQEPSREHHQSRND